MAQLCVQLVDSTFGGSMVHNGIESSFVANVKSMQGLDPIFIQFEKGSTYEIC